MSRRSLVVERTLVLAIGVVAPTLAQRSAQPPPLLAKGFAEKTAKRAKRIAKKTRSLAKAADHKAASARRSAGKAGDAARAAGAQAAEAQKQVDGQKAASATAVATESRAEDGGYVALGGPQVTVTVPPSGLIEARAQATIDPAGAVSLFEDGQQLDGQAPDGICDGPSGALISRSIGNELRLSTPTGTPFACCGIEGPPAPAELSDRILAVALRP